MDIKVFRMTERDINSASSFITGIQRDRAKGYMYKIRSTTPEYYRWMYYDNPAGNAIVYMAKHEDRVIGLFGIAPKRISVKGEDVIIGKTMDMFTHPDYQGKGIMKSLTSRVFEDTRKNGIKTWYVMPSENSYPIFLNKWDYKEIFELDYLVRILKPGDIIESLSLPKIITYPLGKLFQLVTNFWDLCFSSKQYDDYSVKQDQGFGQETDNLWNKMKIPGVAIKRDSVYMNWRYRDNPDDYIIFKYYTDGDIAGISVMKIITRRLMRVGEIMDLMWAEGDSSTFDFMIKHCTDYIKRAGCVLIETWVIHDSNLFSLIKRNGISRKRAKLKFLISPGSDIESVYSKESWHALPGDGNDV